MKIIRAIKGFLLGRFGLILGGIFLVTYVVTGVANYFGLGIPDLVWILPMTALELWIAAREVVALVGALFHLDILMFLLVLGISMITTLWILVFGWNFLCQSLNNQVCMEMWFTFFRLPH